MILARVVGLFLAVWISMMAVQANAQSRFSFQTLASLGDPVPGGVIAGLGTAQFTFDFEPGDINNSGQLAFGADMAIPANPNFSDFGEGVFLVDSKGKISAIARTGDQAPAPDTAIFGPLFLGVVTINDSGVAAVAFHRDNLTFPALLEVNSGLYRYTSAKRQLNVELLPGAPAPGGGTFHGIAFQPVINNKGTIAFGATIETTIGPGNPPGNETGLGLGLFTVDAKHNVSKVARPGDPAPDGKAGPRVRGTSPLSLARVSGKATALRPPRIGLARVGRI